MMTFEIVLVLLVLAITVILFVSEWLRVDVIAIFVMLILVWLKLVTPAQAFSGFAGNAVISIIAVMILGYGVDRSGVMQRLTGPIVKLAGTSQSRLTLVVSATVGLISAFMQNIGAAALFLPALLRISRNTRIPASRLLMPMGFAAILGGTLTMVASGPLIVLNDLLKQTGQKPFGLFGVTPIGLALLGAGLAYFTIFGRSVLPARSTVAENETGGQQELIESWRLPTQIYECVIVAQSKLIGKTREEIGLWKDYHLNLLALSEGDEIFYAPWRYTRFAADQHLALMGQESDIERFTTDYVLRREQAGQFEQLRSSEQGGFAELIIPPRAPIVGKTLREVALRKNFVVEPILLLSGRTQMREDFSDEIFDTGDAMIVYGRWENIKSMDDRKNFVLVTPVESRITGRAKPVTSLLCFLGAIALVVSGMPLSVSLLTGALAMILLKVITIDEAYRAIDWRTVFLLAGLIPLGIAMDNTGAAKYISGLMIQFLGNSHPLLIMTGVALLATVFSLFMSNVAATVLLVPLVIIMGQEVGVEPRALALLVAVCASNSFVLPTHQVNALLMSPGGYHNLDYIKAGGIMTILFLAIAVTLIYLIFI
jgi:di/tricarboxylate transporter